MRRHLVRASRLLAAVALLPLAVQAQSRRISGQITETGTNAPVPEASVQIIGTTLGTTADDAGRFTISVPDGAQQLRVRRIGFRAKVVPVGAGDASVTVALTRDVLQLEAQVITGQATTISRANAANAVSVVSTEQVNRVPQQTVETALQGKVPGAVITQNSGAPGGGLQVQVRGTNTVNGAYDPLYVVDGVIINDNAYANGLNAISAAGAGGTGQQGASIGSNQDQQVNRVADLNPEDIENIEVLKGPSAGAIYGSRGANGVIIITTKHGATGAPSLNVVQRFGTTTIEHALAMRCFSQAEATAFVNAHLPGNYTSADQYFKDYPYAGCTDPQQQLYGHHNLAYETGASLRGGNNATTYFAAGTVKHDVGLARYDMYDKQSLRLNLTQQMGSRVSLQGSSEIVHTLTQRGLSGNDNTNLVPVDVYSATPTFFNFDQRLPNGRYVQNPWVANGSNVLQNADEIKTPEDVFREIASGQVHWSAFSSPRQSLDVTLLGGLDHIGDNSRVYSPPDTYFEQSFSASSFPGSIVNSTTGALNLNLNLSVAHKYTASAFSATTSAGLRQERAQDDFVTDLGNGLFPGITNFATAVQTASAEGQSLTKTLSYYGQEELLTLSERLALTAAVNTERSSTNGDVNKFYAYPKVSASYRLPWLPPKADNLKLRVAYGQAGNRVPVNYKYTYLQTRPQGGVNGLINDQIVGLSTIHPERTVELEGGLDAGFFNGRAGLELTRYQKRTSDLVLTAGVASSTGFTTRVINGGSMINVGTELGLNLIPVQTPRFTWTSNTTFSRNRAEVTSLPLPAFNTGNGFGERTAQAKIAVGYSPTEVFAFKGWDSTFVNGKYVSRARHEFAAGDQAPDFTMGFSNEITMGRLHVTSLLDWRRGGFAANLTNSYFDFNVPGGNLADTAATRQRVYAFNKQGQPVYLEHASFAKLRELTLAYDLPRALMGSFFGGRASSARVELSGRNLFTWTPYSGYDPEVSNFGNVAVGRMWDLTPYPPSRQFFVSINATY